MKIYNGYERLGRNYSLFNDEYEYSMGCGYYLAHKGNEEAVFDIFFRKIPSDGGYAVMAGLDKIIPFIENLSFTERELAYLQRKGYPKDFIEYMKNFKFTGTIMAVPDGTPVFPNEPIITVKAPIIEAQILETCLLSIVNGAMEHATGARRIIEATPENVPVMEFGSRRADGPEAGVDASIYGIMAGCVGTSNTLAADMLNMKALGTMAHSWVESFDTELESFKTFADIYPDNCVLLVDTIDTLRSGIPNAIKTFQYMKEKGLPLDNIGIRIDSGDLTYLSKEARKILIAAGFPQAKIVLSNGLNAKSIKSLIETGAEFDSLGVGDNISKPEGRMGCVYKLVALRKKQLWIPKIKVSEDEIKTTNPDYKKLYRAFDADTGYAIADVMKSHNEPLSKGDMILVSPTNYLKRKKITNFKLVELQRPIFVNGRLVYDDPDILAKRAYCAAEMNKIYPETRREECPQTYHVSGTENYVALKNKMIEEAKRISLKI